MATNPFLRSGLLLAGSRNALKNYSVQDAVLKQDVGTDLEVGIFTAYKASKMDLFRAEFVVLSACESVPGEIICGHGIFGLYRGGGPGAVLKSLWTVIDSATQFLSTRFYRNRLQDVYMEKTFRKAKLSLMEYYPSPCYWGVFVMVE